MSVTDQFINQVMRTAVAGLCQSMGWNSAHSSAIDTLADVWRRHMLHIAKSIQRCSEHDGRSEPNFNDAALVFRDLNISIPELEEYIQNFEPVRLPYTVPNFPVHKESHLNLLRPGSAEVLTRPVHIHEYMPPWETEEKKEKRSGEMNGHGGPEPSSGSGGDGEEMEQAAEVTVNNTEPPGSPPELLKEKEDIEEPVIGAVVEVMDVENENEVEVVETPLKEDSPATPPTGSSLPYSPFSGQAAKSGKRFESSGENPALKRVRLELEEGYPLREIASVMMTTSGFLSSNREGRLPDSRPPLNRDFFDPEPVVEKKKKTLPMTKIVEGIKKLDKEKENQTSGGDNMELFGKPDKITITEIKSRESIAQKYKERSKLSLKLSSKKDFKYGDRELKAEKLKIFKKKTLKGYEKYSKYSKESKKKIRPDPIQQDEDDGLDEISSEEDFNVQQERVKSQPKVESSDKKQKKRDQELLLFLKTKKEKKKEKLMMIPKPKTTPSPNVSTNSEGTPEKKKRGRPRKIPDVSIPQLFGEPFPPILKLPKMPKKLQLDGSKRGSETNMKRVLPPPPDLISFMGRLPMQPGLIPANFGPPPPLRLGGHLPPSISITPATPSTPTSSHLHSSRDGKNSSMPLPSSVCSSVTITRIDMPSSQKLPSQYDASTPGLGNQGTPSVHISVSGRQSPLPAVLEIQPDSNSGITITPILMTGDQPSTTKSGSGLARLEEDMRTKEQKRKDKEKRKELKELKKEKKKEKRDKDKLKEKIILENFEKVEREKKKDRERDRDKDRERDKDKKKKKDGPPTEGLIPKLTLKLHGNTGPLESPKVKSPPPPPRKIIFKPILEDSAKKRTPSPELARFVPLVTRPTKSTKVTTPKPSPPVPSGEKTPGEGNKRGRPPTGRGRGRPPKASTSSQAALVTETVGFYIDEHGTKVWICPCCSRQDDGSPMIGCDTCDDWYHFTCVGITETPDENTSWYCKRCRLKRKSKDNPSFDYKKKVPKL